MQQTTSVTPIAYPASAKIKLTTTKGFILPAWTIALALYAAITIFVTFPLVLHLNDSLTGVDPTEDNTWFVWLLWLFRHAIESGQNPARANQLFALAPQVQNFTPTFFNELLGWPLQYLFSPLTVYNLLLLAGFVLSGSTMYLLTHEFVANRIVCFVAGFIFDFSSYHFIHAQGGQLELDTLQWLPFFVWRVFIFYRKPTLKNAALLGLSMALVAFSALYYVPYFVLTFLALFVVGKLLTDWQWFKQYRHLLFGGLAFLIAAIIAVPPLLDFLHVDSDMQSDLKIEGTAGVTIYSAKLNYFVLPSTSNPFVGGFHNQPDLFIPPEIPLFLGYAALGLSLIALIFKTTRTRRTLFWAVFGLVGILLALGTNLSILGVSPYNLVYSASIFQGFRVPARLAVVPILATAMLSAFALEAIFNFLSSKFQVKQRWLKPSGQIALATGLMSIQLLSTVSYALPSPITPAPVPTVYQQIAADPSNNKLLEMPLQISGSYEYYQTVHHKPLVDGYLGRVTQRMWNSLDTVPYLSQFDVTVPSEDSVKLAGQDIFPLDVDFRQGLAENHIKYVLLHRKWGENVFDRTLQYLTAQLGSPFYRNDAEDVVAWRVDQTPPPPVTANNLRIRLDYGWNAGLLLDQGYSERIVAEGGHLQVETAQDQTRILTFKARPIFKPQTLQVTLNGNMAGTLRLNQVNQLQDVTVPLQLKAGFNQLVLSSVEPCSPAHDYDPSSIDTRCLAFGVQQINFTQP